jgi:beta-glucosidase-like glycosyl hydrolase
VLGLIRPAPGMSLQGHGGGWTAIERLGIPAYFWGNEALHGEDHPCFKRHNGSHTFGAAYCPTVFPSPPNLGASFNLTLVEKIGAAVGAEARALNNAGASKGQNGGENGISLSLRATNINLYRDPRWGRVVEISSEDPLHAGLYGAAIARGIQQQENATHADASGGTKQHYLQAVAEMKHYAAYNVEGTSRSVPPTGGLRFSFNANISKVSNADKPEVYTGFLTENATLD